MLLAIDTSTNWIGLALFDGAQILSEQTWRSQSYHTTELVPAIEEMLTRTQVRRKDLSGLKNMLKLWKLQYSLLTWI